MSKKHTKILLILAIILCTLLFAHSMQQLHATDDNTIVITPPTVESFALHDVGKNQAVVKWDRVSTFNKYELSLTEKNGTTRTHIYDRTVTSAVLKDLKPNTQYTVKIRTFEKSPRMEYFNSTTQQWQLTQPAEKDWANKRSRIIQKTYYGEYTPAITFTTKYDCKGSHTGGTATCVSRATCTKCGEKYGEFTKHSLYFSGKAEDKRIFNNNVNIYTATEYKTYRCRYCKYTEQRAFGHIHDLDIVNVKYGTEKNGTCLQTITYKCKSCKNMRTVNQTISIDDKTRPDNKDAVASAATMLNGQSKYMGIYANDVDVTLTKYKYGFNTIGWSEALDGKIRSDKKLSKCLDDDKLVPFINLLPNKCKLSDIANGVYDHYLMDFFKRVHSDTRTGTVFVCFAPEMDMRPGDTTATNDWQSKNPATFIAAWKRVVTLGREHAPNIVWVWSPSKIDKHARTYYPGSEYVDCVSVTLNDPTLNDATFEAYYKTRGVKKNVESYGKPIMISSAACGFTNQTKQKNYLTGMINYVQSDPAIVGTVIMDTDINSPSEYRFSDNQDIVNAVTYCLGKYNKFEIPARKVDWTTMNASHHKLVCNIQSQTGATGADFLKWYNSQPGKSTSSYSDWSTIAISWAARKAGIPETSVPTVDTPKKLVDFYKAKGTFYTKGNCWPEVGDIVIFDDNKDGNPDRAGTVVFCNFNAGTLVVVGGKMLNEATNEYIIDTHYTKTSNTAIYGYCELEDMGKKVEYSQFSKVFKRNGVDCLLPMTKDAYLKVLKADGIEVVARYINPNGRIPLTREEAQMLSNYGIRVMMIFEIQADEPYKGYDRGYELGTRALQYATEIGAPKGMPIFFCCDCADQELQRYKIAQFIQGIRDAMGNNYGVGMYGPYKTVQALHNAGLIDAVWQCYGASSNYVSEDYDVFQWTGGTYFYDEIPENFDADDVKNVEKVSFIFPPSN